MGVSTADRSLVGLDLRNNASLGRRSITRVIRLAPIRLPLVISTCKHPPASPTTTGAMSEASITIGELEANYQLYCKALKMLVAEKRTLKKIQRTVCWSRLETLHRCLPRHYKSPDYLYSQLLRNQQP